MKSYIKKVINSFGYDIRKIGSFDLRVDARYVLKEYTRPDGSFDYPRYKAIQTAGNLDKISKCWVSEDAIALASDIIKSCLAPKFGLCHGTRRGLEQKWFRHYLQCDVVGTEISVTATQFPDTIQWDFHEVKSEWLQSVDFIYSNSWDHSYDPQLCLEKWMSCLTKEGICLLDYSSQHDSSVTSELDPFGAPLQTLIYLILVWGKGDFFVTNVVEYVSDRRPGCFLIVRRHGFSNKVTTINRCGPIV